MKVKIKTWEAMEKEFGLYNESIKVQFAFNKLMEKQLPKDRIIEVSTTEREDMYLWDGSSQKYAISSGMIEEWIYEDEVKDTIQKIIEDL